MSALTALINAYIKSNHNQEITGPVLNGVLLQLAAAAENVPYIGANGDWFIYDTETGLYQDTGQTSRGPIGVTAATATVDALVGTPWVEVVLNDFTLEFAFHNIKGEQGEIGPAGGVDSVNGMQGNVTGLEETANKVTGMTAASTDTEYPSAKAVYDALLTKQDVIDAMNQLPYAYISGTPAISTDVFGDRASETMVSCPKSVYDYLLSVAGSLTDLVTLDKTNLVAAINEAAQNGGADANAVHYTLQTLTPSQQAQARANIDAVGSTDIPSPLMTYTPSGDIAHLVTPANYVTRPEFDPVAEAVGTPVTDTDETRHAVALSLVTNKCIDTVGNVIDAGNMAYSAPIRLRQGETIHSNTRWQPAAISLTDENGTYYTPVVIPPDADYTIVSYTAVADCYVAVSGKTTEMGADIESSSESLYIDPDQVGFESEETETVPDLVFNAGQFIRGADGTVLPDASFEYTEPIFLAAGDTIEFDFTGGLGTATVAEVLIAGNIYSTITSYPGNVASLTHETYTAASDIWIALCGRSIVNVAITHATPQTSIIPLTQFLEEFEASAKDAYEDLSYFEIPIPQRATINVIAPALSTSKSDTVSAVIEYTDVFHNVFFRRRCALTAQGQSSLAFIEKNQTLDFADCEIKFGDWVPQDSFHLKAYYIDVFRGINNAMYNYAEEVIRVRDCRANRVLESGSTSNTTGAGNFFTDFGSDALCHPDGFPVELYLNGVYYGLYVLGLKKHRANYSMEKTNAAHILMDGELGSAYFWNGTINWTKFEIRNPKDLVCMDGTNYDGDAPLELIDSTSASWNGSNPNHVRSAAVKSTLITLSNARATILAEATDEAKRTAFEGIFDKEMFLTYYVVSQAIDNYDGFYKNWVWTIYSGKAAPNFYDIDSCFGRYWNGSYVFHQPNWGDVENYTDSGSISHLFVALYASEIASVYQQLRAAKVITVDNIIGHLTAWLERVGRSALQRNLDEWTEIPSYRPTAGSNYTDGTATNKGMYDSVERVRLWLQGRISYLDSKYGYNG